MINRELEHLVEYVTAFNFNIPNVTLLKRSKNTSCNNALLNVTLYSGLWITLRLRYVLRAFPAQHSHLNISKSFH